MASLELLPYFWSLNTIPVVKIWNFDFGHLSHPSTKRWKKTTFWLLLARYCIQCSLLPSYYPQLPKETLWIGYIDAVIWLTPPTRVVLVIENLPQLGGLIVPMTKTSVKISSHDSPVPKPDTWHRYNKFCPKHHILLAKKKSCLSHISFRIFKIKLVK